MYDENWGNLELGDALLKIVSKFVFVKLSFLINCKSIICNQREI